MNSHRFSHPLNKQKWANCMGGPAKMNNLGSRLSNAYGSGFWEGSEAVLESVWMIFGSFWAHVEFKNRLGSCLRGLCGLEFDFLASTATILKGLGEVLGRILEMFASSFSMWMSSWILIWFYDDLSLLFVPSRQAKVSKLHRKSCKNE